MKAVSKVKALHGVRKKKKAEASKGGSGILDSILEKVHNIPLLQERKKEIEKLESDVAYLKGWILGKLKEDADEINKIRKGLILAQLPTNINLEERIRKLYSFIAYTLIPVYYAIKYEEAGKNEENHEEGDTDVQKRVNSIQSRYKFLLQHALQGRMTLDAMERDHRRYSRVYKPSDGVFVE